MKSEDLLTLSLGSIHKGKCYYLYKYFQKCMLCEKFPQASQCLLGPRFISMYWHTGGSLSDDNSIVLPVTISVAI